MLDLIRYDPYDPFRNMRRMLSLFDDTIPSIDANSMAVNVSSDDRNVIVTTAVPGIREEDIHVDVRGNLLTISAEARTEFQDKNQHWHIREWKYGKFTRTVELPDEVNSDKAEATLENGVLTVTLPKSHVNPVQNIVVKVKNLLSGGKNNK
jgi:HSP20 family protein